MHKSILFDAAVAFLSSAACFSVELSSGTLFGGDDSRGVSEGVGAVGVGVTEGVPPVLAGIVDEEVSSVADGAAICIGVCC